MNPRIEEQDCLDQTLDEIARYVVSPKVRAFVRNHAIQVGGCERFKESFWNNDCRVTKANGDWNRYVSRDENVARRL